VRDEQKERLKKKVAELEQQLQRKEQSESLRKLLRAEGEKRG
jgi:hypothetical protein